MSMSHIRTEAGAPGADSALFDDDRMGSLYHHMVAMAAAFGAPMLLVEWLSAKLGLSEVSAFAVGFMPLELMVMGALARSDPETDSPGVVARTLGYAGAGLLLLIQLIVVIRWSSLEIGRDGPLHAMGIIVGCATAVSHCRFGGRPSTPVPREWILFGLECAFILIGLSIRQAAPESGLIAIAIFGAFGIFTVGPAWRRHQWRTSRAGLPRGSGRGPHPRGPFAMVQLLWCLLLAALLWTDSSVESGLSRTLGLMFVAVGLVVAALSLTRGPRERVAP